MFLGHLYFQLELVHVDELEDNSCYITTSSLHCTMFKIFVWKHYKITLAKSKKLKYIKEKCQGSLDIIKGLCDSLIDEHRIIFH